MWNALKKKVKSRSNQGQIKVKRNCHVEVMEEKKVSKESEASPVGTRHAGDPDPAGRRARGCH
eukprot:748378-Hanusia_phi.AAC.2